MSKDSTGRSFTEYLQDAPLAPDSSAKLTLTGEVRRSATDGKFVFSSPEVGTVELDVEAVTEFEPQDGGLTRITVSMNYLRDRRAGMSGGRGRVPFVLTTPHHAAAAAIRDQLRKAESTAAILDVETAYIKDVWIDETTDPIKDAFEEETLPAFPFR